MTICLLALSAATLAFPTSASAIPRSATDLHPTSSEPAPGPPATGQPPGGNDRDAANQTASASSSSVQPSEVDIGLSPPAGQREIEPRQGIPCLFGSPSEMPCSGASAGRQRFSIQFGSRLGTRTEMLGEYDGIRVDYRLTGGLMLNGVAGYPVLSTNDKFNAASRMFGINAVTTKFARAWDLNSYLVEQRNSGKVSTRSVGAAVRYRRPGRSLLVFLDYDIFEHSLGSFMASGAWKLPHDGTLLSATLDIRNSRMGKQQRKYLEQTMVGSDGWQWILPDSRIDHYTRERSNKVATLAVGLSHSFAQGMDLSGDIATMDIYNSAAADDGTTAAARWREYFYHLKLSGTDMIMPGDRNRVDLRHRVTRSSRISAAAIDASYPINRFWKISPRLRAERRNNTFEDSVQWVTAPAVKMEYLGGKRHGFQIQAGGEWSVKEDPDGGDTRFSYFASLEYKVDF